MRALIFGSYPSVPIFLSCLWSATWQATDKRWNEGEVDACFPNDLELT